MEAKNNTEKARDEKRKRYEDDMCRKRGKKQTKEEREKKTEKRNERKNTTDRIGVSKRTAIDKSNRLRVEELSLH